MQAAEVPEVVVLRLPWYVRALTRLLAEGTEVVRSQQLGSQLLMSPAQIRKDLSYFGRFGKQGRGYDVRFLLSELRQILGLDREWFACVVGVGRLGRGIINYTGFTPECFTIVAAFDSDLDRVGTMIGGLRVQPMSEIGQTIEDKNITIGIVAVPAGHAQSVVDELTGNGVRGILNYAPMAPQVPFGTITRNIDPVLALQSMTFYLQRDNR